MSVEDASRSVTAAKDELRDKWQSTGDTDALTCPDCDAAEYEWEVDDTSVTIRCEQCHYGHSQRYES